MGCGGSKSLLTRESPLSEALERKMIHAIVNTKRTKSINVKKSSFNNLMLQLPKLTSGFKKIREAYAAATAPSGKVTWGAFRAACGQNLGLDPDSDTLKEVLTLPEVDDAVMVTHADLIVMFTVVFLLDGASKRRTIASSDVRACLDLMEKSFMFFDSSADGCIERKELAMALKSGTRVFGRKASKTLADRLFDQLDWSKDGQITFKEYLVGMERIIIETSGDEEEDLRQLGVLGDREEEEEGDPKDVNVDIMDEGPQEPPEQEQQQSQLPARQASAAAAEGTTTNGVALKSPSSSQKQQVFAVGARPSGSLFPPSPDEEPFSAPGQLPPLQRPSQQQQLRQSQRQLAGEQVQQQMGQFEEFEQQRMLSQARASRGRLSAGQLQPAAPEPVAVPDSTDEVLPFSDSGMGEPESPIRRPVPRGR